MDQKDVTELLIILYEKLDVLQQKLDEEFNNISKRLRDLENQIKNDGSRLARARNIVECTMNIKG